MEDQCKLDIRKFSFSKRNKNEWNRLSTDCVNANSENMFKNKIYKYLKRAGYISLKKPMVSLSTCPLDLLPWMAILLNLGKSRCSCFI